MRACVRIEPHHVFVAAVAMITLDTPENSAAEWNLLVYYAATATSGSSRSLPHTSTTTTATTSTIESNNHQRILTNQALTGVQKRESPLDLSVKTVRQSADSTAKDDYESNFISTLDPFQQRSLKLPGGKVVSSRSATVVPNVQLPSAVSYPHLENHSTNKYQNATGGAPKVDFLPNFNAHHNSGSAQSFQDPNKRQRSATVSQNLVSSHYTHVNTLPHMDSFKKITLSATSCDDLNKQAQYYPTTGSLQRTSLANHSPSNVQQHLATAPVSQYHHYDPLRRGSSVRNDLYDRQHSASAMQSTPSNELNYRLGKRRSSSSLKDQLAPKFPKVDTWRQTIDQQIEQRLNSYASSRGHLNGTGKDGSLSSNPSVPKQTSYSSASTNLQTPHVSVNLPSSNALTSRQSLFSSHLSSVPPKVSLANQYYPQNQSQYVNLGIPHRTATEFYNTLSQTKLSSPQSNGAADKRVLSILRKRLDTREQQQQLMMAQDRSKIYTSLAPEHLVVPSPIVSSDSKPSQMSLGRHHLPPFNALSIDRNVSAMPYPNQKLHIPRAMDSVGHEYSQNNFSTRSDVPRSNFLPRTDVSLKPTSGDSGTDFDGLAAFLAARIRTKAELKQVGPSIDQQQRIPTPASGSNSSAHSPHTTPGIFSPPPSMQIHYSALPGHLGGKVTPTLGVNTSPVKPVRDKCAVNSPRRRLFSRAEEEGGATSEAVIRSREVGLRSSSETSVFDFRESDSEGETTGERQSLHEMRKDRDKRLQEKHLAEPAPSPDPTRDPNETVDTEKMDDGFWSEMCEQFVDQLQKGGKKIRRRGRRKKCHSNQIEADGGGIMQQFEDIKSEADGEGMMQQFEDIKSEADGRGLMQQFEEIKSETDGGGIMQQFEEIESDIQCSRSVPLDEQVKIEKSDNCYLSISNVKAEVGIKKESIIIIKDNIKKEEESSDEDAPLSLKKVELPKILKIEDTGSNENKDSLSEGDKIVKKLDSICIKKEIVKDEFEAVEKKEMVNSDSDSSADEGTDSVAKRLRVRPPKRKESGATRKTRANEKENSNSPQKCDNKRKGEKKKSVYGDGSDYRPGWEAEVYRYKRSLRMPTRLINIAGPQSWPRLSVSLPDLDPDSPHTLDSDISLQNNQFDSDGQTTPTKTKTPQKKSQENKKEDSFLNRLIQRYGSKGKKSFRKVRDREGFKDKKGPRIIPQTTELQLLPTPSIDCIVKMPKKYDQVTSQNKKTKGKKSKKFDRQQHSDFESKETVFLGYFRKNTVTEFRDAFAKHNGGFATEHELPPIMLKSRTRTQTRVLTHKATIKEIFGDDRPASAPPAGCRAEEENDKSGKDEKRTKSCTKNKILKKRKKSVVGSRPGLRSAAFLRSSKAVMKSKQQLFHGIERRRRSKDLIKAYKSKKNSQIDSKSKCLSPEGVLEDTNLAESNTEGTNSALVGEKRLKYRNVRRKLKSSGFDYIRKKKKQQQKKEGDTDSLKEKKKGPSLKPLLVTEEDIQNEIKGWVINKGLGETILHRAARLGYIDVATYCLEKMDHNPSPQDNAGYTPLHEACAKGQLEIAMVLLMYGANVSDSAHGGIRPLHEAAESGCVELMRLLLSYGADPLLATYTGVTPISLAHNHPEARALLQQHLIDVQGGHSSMWQLDSMDKPSQLPFLEEDPPSEESCDSELEVESGELSLPHLYQLVGEPATERWVLFQELGPVLRVKTREALIKQLGPNHRNDFRDLKMSEFYNMARCCAFLGVGDYILNPKAHKVTLVKYSERVRTLLNSEKVKVTLR